MAVRRFGAAAVEMRALSIVGGGLLEVFRVSANDVTIAREGDTVLLVAHNFFNGIDVPDLYVEKDGKFVKASLWYPGFYRKVLADQHLTAESGVSLDLR